MARYIDADKALEFIKETNANYHWLLAQYNAQWVYDFIESQPTADVIPKSEVDRLEKALAAKDAEHDQALQDKARECNMAIDKIHLVHREQIRRLKELHAEDLTNVTRDLAIEIFFGLDNLIKTVLLDNGDGTIAAVNTQEYIEFKKKYMRK